MGGGFFHGLMALTALAVWSPAFFMEEQPARVTRRRTVNAVSDLARIMLAREVARMRGGMQIVAGDSRACQRRCSSSHGGCQGAREGGLDGAVGSGEVGGAAGAVTTGSGLRSGSMNSMTFTVSVAL